MQMKMQMKLNQQLIMTPQLQQAIKLLQLSHTELEELIEQTLVENPVLEEGMDIDSFPNRETPAAEENPETPEVASGTEDFENERFLVTPHTEVLEYVSRKGNDRDRWISGMQRLQERYEDWKPGED